MEDGKERRFSNEIFVLIMENLAEDVVSLRNTSIVCRDLASLSQSFIFRTIDLVLPSSKGDRFLSLLRDPQTVSLGKLVQKLTLYAPSDAQDIATTSFILQNLTSLVSFRMICPHYVELYWTVIGAHLGAKLQELQLSRVMLRTRQASELFQNMLYSLKSLKYLALTGVEILDTEWTLFLPSSLEILALAYISEATFNIIGHGMKASPNPPALQTFFIDDKTCVGAAGNCEAFWKALNSDTQIILDVGFCAVYDGLGKF
ncbi:hypothetical protein GYMLUDRAFT_460038 [Collybiopsis luxurians FD-317 M1]|jgi:hypothetical protein|uniref:F-box domain-containing protein n=1 Tax=Collybiopsis luxurians FD-317 M1 TaxID=944289 RepID=A0A0D0C6W7_9AGAR|nr:hypothetical protein GYMLUDRAFT_460038 [Collybiopsis luxurians FD-317 M1]